MIFDGFFIYHLVAELNENLKKARLEKIYQNDEQSFVFAFYARGTRFYMNLFLSPQNVGLYVTQHQTLGSTSSQFLSTMKKHLEGAILEEIMQYESDRVITFHFTAYDFIDGPVKKELIFEAMGRHSNLMIVKDGIIVDTLKKMFFEEGRQLLPQATFEYFPSDKKPFFSIDYENIHSPKDLVDHYMGISPYLAKYLYEHQVQLKDIPVNPTKVLKSQKGYVFDLFEPSLETLSYDSISKMMDDTKKNKQSSYLKHEQFIIKHIQKYEKKISLYELQLQDAKENVSHKHIGDMIYQSGHDVGSHMSSVDVYGEIIHLDATLTLNQNAQKHYKLYQKAKRSIHHIEQQLIQQKEMLDMFYEYQTYLSFSNEASIKELEKELIPYGFKAAKTKTVSKKQQKPHILTLQDQGITYYIGKNNLQNEYVTHQLAKKDDYWFHVKDAPGGHIVVTTSTLDEYTLRKACMLAAYFSSQRLSSSIPVDYVQVKHIKKIPGLPSYKVTYKHHQTMYIDIDQTKIDNYLKTV